MVGKTQASLDAKSFDGHRVGGAERKGEGGKE